MRLIKAIVILLCCLALTAQAQDRAESSSKQRAETKAKQATAQTRAVEAAPVAEASRNNTPAKGAPGRISAAPGTVLTLCCGSLDPHSMAGSNCAYMHTGQGCGGFILACPEGTKDTVKEDGTGYCKETD